MTNEELKAAIRDFNNAYNYEEDNEEHVKLFDGRYTDIFEYWRELDIITQAARELSQLKDGTHPDMVMVPREPTRKQLDAAVTFALNVKLHKDYGWINYTADLYKMMIAAQKGKQNEN